MLLIYETGTIASEGGTNMTPVIVGVVVAVSIIIIIILSAILCVVVVVKKQRKYSYKNHNDSKKLYLLNI